MYILSLKMVDLINRMQVKKYFVLSVSKVEYEMLLSVEKM